MKKLVSLILVIGTLAICTGCGFSNQTTQSNTEATDDSIVDEIDAGLGSKVESTGSVQID